MALQLRRQYQFQNNFYDVETTVYNLSVDRNSLDQNQLQRMRNAVDEDRVLLLGSIFERVFLELHLIIQGFDPHDRIQVTVQASDLTESVSSTVSRVDQFCWQTLFQQLLSVLNSNE